MAVQTRRTGVGANGAGNVVNALASIRGEQVFLPYQMQWALEGRCFVISSGSETTPLTAVAYDQDQPELTVAVPSGTTIIPLYMNVTIETSTGTAKELIMWRVTNEIGAGTSSAVTEGPTNLLLSGGLTSGVTARQLHTANVTLTSYIELWRDETTIASIAPFTWTYRSADTPIIMRGPGSLGVQLDGTTTQPTYFLKLVYAEFLSADLGL